MAINVIKTIRVNQATNSSSDSVTSFNLDLTFFDLSWLNFHPNQRVIFYKLSESLSESFYSLILPKLEASLSLVLRHYFPLAGRLTWDPQEAKPSVVVSKTKDPPPHVSLTIAETDADFSFVSGNGLRPAIELHPLVPELTVSDDSATVLSLQITLFPNQGFCIGMTSHHAVVDGKSSTMFIKSWAHFCKLLQESHEALDFLVLPDDLTPSFDRTVINIPRRLESMVMELFSFKDNKDRMDPSNSSRRLKIPPMDEISPDIIRATLELTPKNIEKLRKQVKNNSVHSPLELHLSTLIAYACKVKARGGEANRPVYFFYAADLRERFINSQVPSTYFGNFILPLNTLEYQARTFLEEDGFVNAVKILSDSVKGFYTGLGSRRIESLCEETMAGWKKLKPGAQLGSVAGSTRLGVYGTDFGWGKPVKTDVVPIDSTKAISMSERRDEEGGVETGICLKESEMNIFLSLFNDGLSD